MALASRQAAWELSAADIGLRNNALLCMAKMLLNRKDEIFAANAADYAQAEQDGLAAPLLKRLIFREEKLLAVMRNLEVIV